MSNGKVADKYERRKQEEAKQTKLLPPAAPDNRLTRQTAFMCNFKFRNELPEVPADPKLLVTPFDKEAFIKYRVTSLERDQQQKFWTEPDLGIPIDVMDTSIYAVPKEKPPLAPEDEALLREDDGEEKPGAGIQRKRDLSVSWLLRTSYITNDLYVPVNAQHGMSEKQVKSLKNKELGTLQQNTREDRIAAIERSFEAAREEPRHQTRPDLRPVEILPVFPDFDRWSMEYVYAVFDADPTMDHTRTEHLPDKQREQLMRFAALKSYKIMTEDGKTDNFFACMLPDKDLPVDEEGRSGAVADVMDMYESEEGMPYEWVREYKYRIDLPEENAKQEMYCFRFHDNYVTYTDLNTKLILHKKKAKAGGVDVEHERPRSITLKRRERDELEMMSERKKRNELLNLHEPEEEVGEVEEEDDEAGGVAGPSQPPAETYRASSPDSSSSDSDSD